jgi:hypothetical protein
MTDIYGKKRNTVIVFNTCCFVPHYNYIMCCHLQYLGFVVYDVIIKRHSVCISISPSYAVIRLRCYSAASLDEVRSPYLGQLVSRPTCESGMSTEYVAGVLSTQSQCSVFFILPSTQGPCHRREYTCVLLTMSLSTAAVTGYLSKCWISVQ